MKTCTKCKETKPLSEFCKDKRTKDGLSGWCKDCVKSYNKEYQKSGKRKEYYKQYAQNKKIKNKSAIEAESDSKPISASNIFD
jgi:hypothetical protein